MSMSRTTERAAKREARAVAKGERLTRVMELLPEVGAAATAEALGISPSAVQKFLLRMGQVELARPFDAEHKRIRKERRRLSNVQ